MQTGHSDTPFPSSKLLIQILCVFFSFNAFSFAPDSLLDRLHREIENKDVYVQAKVKRIEALRESLTANQSLVDQFDLCNKLYNEYKAFIYDSAFKYTQKLSQIARLLRDPVKINYAKVTQSFVLVSSGMFKETFDSLRTVNAAALSDTSKIEYYSILARANLDVGSYDDNPHFNSIYVSRGSGYLDSALALCKPGEFRHLAASSYKKMVTGKVDEALSEANKISRMNITLHQHAVNNHHIGSLYLAKGDTNRALVAFVNSAICDIQSATKENTAMNSVAGILYRKGDIENAYALVEQAMEDATYYGAKQRKIEVGKIFPIIEGSWLKMIEENRRSLILYSVVITVLTLVLVVFIIIFFKQMARLKAADKTIMEANRNLQEINHHLVESNKIKEEYIGYYFTINSDYVDKIENFKRTIDQKLTTRKFDDIKHIVNNIDLKQEREELHLSFDKVFLNLFPDFVTAFNTYFDEKDRIILKDGQLLNTELRIFALIRMGINDNEKIARILNYSVNTIATYKTRVKGKSLLPNEEFERKIMEIKAV